MRRHTLGLIVLASFAWAAIPCWYHPLERYQAAGDMGLRVGLVLGALWLAWPDLHRLPDWVWYVLPIVGLALIFAKAYLAYLFPGLLAIMAFYLLYRKICRSPR